MKTKLIFLVLLIASYSCGTNRSVSESEKEKTRGEVKEIVHTIFKGAEEADFNKVIETWYDSPDFVYMCNGKTYNYKECMGEMKQFLDVLLNQECTIVDEKYAVIDNSTVLGTINTKWLMNFKDGHSVLQDPWAVQFTFRKIDNRWRVIYHVESGVEKTVKYAEKSRELNQVELMKQWIGIWKSDIAKDTSGMWVTTAYGTGLEGIYKYTTKGKTYLEGKEFAGYDIRFDKFIAAQMFKWKDIELYAVWFTSKNKCVLIPFGDISNPESASFRTESTFISSAAEVDTTFVNNKPVKTETWTRVK
jgi:hypothetical protein